MGCNNTKSAETTDDKEAPKQFHNMTEEEKKKIKMQIWDTAGQERFKNIIASYYRGAHGILLIYDVTDKESFKNLSNWLIEIEKNASKNVLKVLIGNKTDLEEKRVITYNQGKEFADSYGLKYIETSAKKNLNVNEAFETLGRELMQASDDKKIGKSKDKKISVTKAEDLNQEQRRKAIYGIQMKDQKRFNITI